MPGSTASSQDRQQPIAQLDWLSSWKLNYVSLLQVSATKNDLNNVQAGTEDLLLGSPLLVSLQREGIPARLLA